MLVEGAFGTKDLGVKLPIFFLAIIDRTGEVPLYFLGRPAESFFAFLSRLFHI